MQTGSPPLQTVGDPQVYANSNLAGLGRQRHPSDQSWSRFSFAWRVQAHKYSGVTFAREILAQQATSLAVQGVFIGTSSWKYPGWSGVLYDRARYEWRGKFAESRFKRDCLAEYGEVFKTVCVDAAYYTFPSQKYLEGMVAQVPEDFLFGFKVTDAITVKRFPRLDRFGVLAGKQTAEPIAAEMGAMHQIASQHIRPP